MSWIKIIAYALTHRPCPMCNGNSLHMQGCDCCLCGGEGVVPHGQKLPEAGRD